MASSDFIQDSLFEETQISSVITAHDAPAFFQEHGIFYQASADIGSLAGPAPKIVFNEFKQSCFRDPRLRQILEPYNPVTPAFNLDADPGNFYVFTTEQDVSQRVFVFVWGEEAQLEFSYGSPTKPLKGRRNEGRGMTHIPYSQLTRHGCTDIKIGMKKGGAMIVHPRLAINFIKGLTAGWGCQKAV